MRIGEVKVMKLIIPFLIIGTVVTAIMWFCSKIGSDGNWYAEHMTENTPDNDPEQ